MTDSKSSSDWIPADQTFRNEYEVSEYFSSQEDAPLQLPTSSSQEAFFDHFDTQGEEEMTMSPYFSQEPSSSQEEPLHKVDKVGETASASLLLSTPPPTIIKVQKKSVELPSLLSILPSRSTETKTMSSKDVRENNDNASSEHFDFDRSQNTSQTTDSWNDDDVTLRDEDLQFVTDSYGKDYLLSKDSSGRTIYIDMTTGSMKYHLYLPSKRKKWTKDYPKSLLKKFFTERKYKIKALVTKPAFSSIDSSRSLGNEVMNYIKSSLDDSQSMNIKWGREKNQNNEGIFSQSESLSTSTSTKNYEGLKLGKLMSSKSIKFERDDLSKIQVLFQVDKKFILGKCTSHGTKELVILFDQHAVHERIRVERLLKGKDYL
jgi:DNA mismatch repair ATPase MutL